MDAIEDLSAGLHEIATHASWGRFSLGDDIVHLFVRMPLAASNSGSYHETSDDGMRRGNPPMCPVK